MRRLPARLSIIAAVALATLGLATAQQSTVVAHEWGTFTTVAGPDGRSAQWIPLGGPVDLPCFVNVFGADPILGSLAHAVGGMVDVLQLRAANGSTTPILVRSPITILNGVITSGGTGLGGGGWARRLIEIDPATGLPKPQPPPLSYDQARATMRGTLRMETPVIHFYSEKQENVSVGVTFPAGFISEWYPAALVTQPPPAQISLDSNLNSTVMWKNIAILPGQTTGYRSEEGKSNYYAARETDANPLMVNGQYEKFLFYGGIGGFEVPLNAVETKDGGIKVRNDGKVPVPMVLLVESRDGKLGYTVQRNLTGEVTLRGAPLTSDVATLGRDLEKMLVDAGMFAKEAKAMVNTWRDSWFEEGTRLFYLMPTSVVNEALPLAMVPKPKELTRAFVGRIEVITRETLRRVSIALDTENEAMLLRYGRFLGPITDRLMEGAPPATVASTKTYVNTLFADYVTRIEKKCK